LSFSLSPKSAIPFYLGLALSMASWTSLEARQPRVSKAVAHAWGHTSVASSDVDFPEEKLAGLKSFAVYALSRGSGVPEAASQLIVELRSLYQTNGTQREVSRYVEDRIGLEGETRVCLEFDTANAAQIAWKEVRVLIGEKELIDLRAEECTAR
jgi:hypothetical protein